MSSKKKSKSLAAKIGLEDDSGTEFLWDMASAKYHSTFKFKALNTHEHILLNIIIIKPRKLHWNCVIVLDQFLVLPPTRIILRTQFQFQRGRP